MGSLRSDQFLPLQNHSRFYKRWSKQRDTKGITDKDKCNSGRKKTTGAVIVLGSPSPLGCTPCSPESERNLVYKRRKRSRNSQSVVSSQSSDGAEVTTPGSMAILVDKDDNEPLHKKDTGDANKDIDRNRVHSLRVYKRNSLNRGAVADTKNESRICCFVLDKDDVLEHGKFGDSKNKVSDQGNVGDSEEGLLENGVGSIGGDKREVLCHDHMLNAKKKVCENENFSFAEEDIGVIDGTETLRDWVHSILRMSGPIRGDSSTSEATKCNGDYDRTKDTEEEACKVCGEPGSLDEMLICDSCEGAFHMACAKHGKNKAFLDEWWYCRHCKGLRKKILSQSIFGTLGSHQEETSSESGTSHARRKDFISFMLNDTTAYTTQARIGKGFQADVPEWSGPLATDDDNSYVGDPLDEACQGHNIKRFNKELSIGNWLQCQSVIDHKTAASDNGQIKKSNICGKWRRAPLFEVQTDDWECFCAVLWDPYHADCAVPQELPTETIQMHLKYLDSLKAQLARKPHGKVLMLRS